MLQRIVVRLPPGFDVEALHTRLEERCNGGRVQFSPVEPAIRMDKNNRLVRAFLRAIRRQGGTPVFKLKTGTSDMNLVGRYWKDCPMVAYGPGDSALDHAPNEHTSIAEYRRAVAVLTDVLEHVPVE